MKTFILATVSAAALMTAGAASAQTFPYGPYATTSTQGSAQTSSSVDQTGTGNTATVDQQHATGAQNTSVIVQGTNANNANGSSASVSQTGIGQRALTMQTNNNTSSTSQSGGNNDAFTYQTGSNNRASTTQSALSTPAKSGNIAGVNGSGSTGGGDALASSLSGLSEAQAETLVETGVGAPTDGNATASYIVQASGAYNNSANVNQSDVGNRAAIVQINSETNSVANVTQTTGPINDAVVYQGGGNSNNGAISQSGGYTTAVVYQYGSTGSIASVGQSGNQSGNIGFAVQTGIGQQSYITQSGALDQARSDQSGAFNFSGVSQTGYGATGTIYQSGTGNVSSLNQNGSGTALGVGHGNSDGDTADVTQQGNSNGSYVTQNIGNAWAHVGQTGTSNSSSVYQH